MKIREEHFKTLKKHVLETIEKHPHAKREYADAGFSAKRYRWDALFVTFIDGEESSTWIRDNLHEYLNDDDIDTALRCIVE